MKSKYALMAGIITSTLADAALAQEKSNMDERIVRVLERRLEWDDAVLSQAIKVTSSDREVTLSGAVDNLLTKERAIAIAQSIRGVREVREQISVKPRLRPDAHIRQNVIDALRADIAADVSEIDVRVTDGIVTLAGNVQSWQEKYCAERAAKSVAGIKAIENELQVRYMPGRSDADIEHDIRSRLKWDVWMDGPALHVDVANGRVTLTGVVESVFEKERAYGNAWVAGVKSVDTGGVKISDLQLSGRAKPAPLQPDKQLEEAFRQASSLDPLVSSLRPEMEVRGGVATLTGSVPSLRAKQRAEEIAHNISGIARVQNQLKVRLSAMPTDAELVTQVRLALGRAAQLEDDDLRAKAENGRVYLSGIVDSEVERAQAEAVASGVIGVLSIRNALAVAERGGPGKFEDSEPAVTDASIKYWTEEHLWLTPGVNASEITVSVENGVVTLSGAVDSRRERRVAEEAAREAGAMRVKNDLKVAAARTRR